MHAVCGDTQPFIGGACGRPTLTGLGTCDHRVRRARSHCHLRCNCPGALRRIARAMTWRDAIRLAVRELGRRPGRAALTLMAVTLATALLSALLAVAGTAQTRVLSQIADGGPLASISVSPAAPDPTQAGLDNPRSGPPRDLTVQALARMRALPHVRSVVAVTATDVYLVPPALPPKGSTECREPRACIRDPGNGGEPDR